MKWKLFSDGFNRKTLICRRPSPFRRCPSEFGTARQSDLSWIHSWAANCKRRPWALLENLRGHEEFHKTGFFNGLFQFGMETFRKWQFGFSRRSKPKIGRKRRGKNCQRCWSKASTNSPSSDIPEFWLWNGRLKRAAIITRFAQRLAKIKL